MLWAGANVRNVMRSLPIPLLLATFFLPANTAIAQTKAQPFAMVPRVPFYGTWENLMRARAAAPPAGSPVKRHTADPSCLPGQLRAAVGDVSARFGPVSIISTHRPGARIRGGRPSLHASCRAVDFKPAPGSYGKVASYLRQNWSGGVGTYSTGHIHIDVGERYRWHSGR